jgi:hypothetical protein
MSDNKKEIEKPGLSTEEVKELELDEQPKPTRKVSHPLLLYQIKKNQVRMIKEKEEEQ